MNESLSNTNARPEGPRLSTRKIAVAGVLAAITIVLGWTRIGFIPIPLPFGDATIMHVPVILGAILEGPVVGIILGAIFGIFSLIQVSVVDWFKDPLISILPRLFIGVLAWLGYRAFKRWNEWLALIVGGVVGTLTNTIFTLGMLVVRGKIDGPTAVGFGLAAGPPEIAVAVVVLLAVMGAWKGTGARRGGSRL
ncbi:MAG: ECF transporter S component [Chloroflexi bacterium]|nr:ECF transporter S component [Chloroflexota bacterium]